MLRVLEMLSFVATYGRLVMVWDDLHVLMGLLPLNGMLGVMVVNHFLADRRSAGQRSTDALRVRVALRTELLTLRSVYEANLTTLDEGREFLLSSRPFVTVYRANLGRLTLFDEMEIGAIVGAYAYTDIVEGTIAANTKAHGGLAYRVLEGEAPVPLLRRELAEASERVVRALDVLEARRGFSLRRMPGGGMPPALTERAARPRETAGVD